VTGIILVTHDALGEAVRREAENILDRPIVLTTVAVSYRAEVEETLAALRMALATGGDTQGAVVLTDLPGATPHNLAMRAADEHDIPVVSGLNLPMLLKAINHADKPPAELAALAADGGAQGILRT
jgi:mannose/fructose-specific phosphotransferase system component IIA